MRKQKQCSSVRQWAPLLRGFGHEESRKRWGWLKRDEMLQELSRPVCLAKMREGEVELKRREEGAGDGTPRAWGFRVQEKEAASGREGWSRAWRVQSA